MLFSTRRSPSHRLDAIRDLGVRNICVIKPSALGDVVQALPILGALRHQFPDARISWVIASGLADLIEGHSQLDDVLHYPRRGTWSDSLRLLKQLRHEQFDLTIDLQGLLRSAVMVAATNAKYRIGLESTREGSQLSHNITLPNTSRDVPAHQRYWNVAEAIGAGHVNRDSKLPIRNEDFRWVDQRFGGGRILTVNPGARWATKRWPAENFAKVAAKAATELGFKIVITGGNEDVETANRLHESLASKGVDDVCDLAGKTTLKQLSAVLSRSECVLTNDSGPMHMAAAVGTPVTGIFTCTSPILSGPPGEQHELVTASVACAASYKKRCPNAGSQNMCCFNAVSVEQVWMSVRRIAGRRQLVAA